MCGAHDRMVLQFFILQAPHKYMFAAVKELLIKRKVILIPSTDEAKG